MRKKYKKDNLTNKKKIARIIRNWVNKQGDGLRYNFYNEDELAEIIVKSISKNKKYRRKK